MNSAYSFSKTGLLLAAILLAGMHGLAAPAARQAAGGATAVAGVLIDTIVFEIDRIHLVNFGVAPESADFDFSENVPSGVALGLADSPLPRIIHRPRLSMDAGETTFIRIGSRVPAGGEAAGEKVDAPTRADPVPPPEYLEAAMDLRITPAVAPDGRIMLTVDAQIQVIGHGGGAEPQPLFASASRPRIVSMVEGQTAVLGGFLTAGEAQTLAGIPELAATPILGFLFSGDSAERNAGLVVMLTPHILWTAGPPPPETAPLPPAPPAATEPAAPAIPEVPVISEIPASNVQAAAVEAARIAPSTPVIAAQAATQAAAPAVAPAPATAAPAAGNDPAAPPAIYTVQIGSFANEQTAQTLRSRLEMIYANVSVEPVLMPGGDRILHRVRVGRLSDLRSARELEQRLRSDGYDTFVAPLN